jgi:hypothetical protein
MSRTEHVEHVCSLSDILLPGPLPTLVLVKVVFG